MNISNLSGKTNKWAVVAASSLLLASVVAGCGNKGGDASGGTTSGTTTPASTEFNGSDVVATVNGANITRADMYPQLVVQAGEPVLTQFINTQLVMQELKKNGLNVTDAEVEAFFTSHKAQDPRQAEQIDKIMKEGGSIWQVVQQRARLQLATEKLVTKDVKADPAAVKAWFTKNQARYGTPASVKVGLLFAGTKVRADTMLAQLKAKSKIFAQLVDDQKKSGDPAGANSTAEQSVPADRLAKDKSPLGLTVQKLGVGTFSPVVTVPSGQGKSAFAIATVTQKTPEIKADFAKNQAQAETDYKLEQVAREQLAKQPGGQKFEQVITQIEGSVQQQNAQQGRSGKVSYHDLLGVLTQSKLQEIQTRLHDSAKVTVSDTDLKKVAEQFKGSPSVENATSTSSNAASNSAAPAPAAPAPAAPAASPAKP